jgi:hypothetical protein
VDSGSELSGLDHINLQTILISGSMGDQALEHRQAPRSAADDRDPIHDREATFGSFPASAITAPP